MITSDRTEFIGGHVTPDIKKCLEEEANRRGLSVSMLLYKILKSTFSNVNSKEKSA